MSHPRRSGPASRRGDPAAEADTTPVFTPVNTERLWWLRLYRRLLPRPVRSYVAARVSPDRRSRVLLRAAAGDPLRRLWDRAAYAWLRARHPALVKGRILVRVNGPLRIATPRADASPLGARRETLDLVCAALTAAQVPFFTVRPFRDTRSAVAVAEPDRTAAVAALRAACAPVAAYVGHAPDDRLGSTAWRSAAGEAVIRITRYQCSPDGLLVLGSEHCCDVEFWRPDGDDLLGPRPNPVAQLLPRTADLVTAPEGAFTRLVAYRAAGAVAEDTAGSPAAGTPGSPAEDTGTRGRPGYPTRPEFTARLIDDIDFPIDIVYTWVDGADPRWRSRRDAALGLVGTSTLNEQAANESRFISRDELRYSLRSVAMYAPWVRHIWIITDDQVPEWLDPAASKITIVDHREIFTDVRVLPTFNSHAIETQLHHIEGLTEHFLYFNDDVFLGRPVVPADFFLANGMTRFFLSKAQIAFGRRTVFDPPVLAAGKNNRRLIEQAFGRVITQKMKHVPSPLRRSILDEIEQRFAAESAATAGHRFRHPDDISIPTSLHHYYGFMTGRSVPGALRYAYTDLSDRETPYRLRRMLAERRHQTFCLNDTDSDAVAQARQLELMSWFLRAYYPIPSPYELPGTDVTGSAARRPPGRRAVW